jgi:H+/Cl- antiporter ClcA
MLLGTSFARQWIAANARQRRLLFPLACGLVVALTGLATHGATWGTGYEQASAAVEGHALAWYFWPAKLLATLATAISGIPGGIFAPSLAVGAGLGAWLASCGGLAVGLGAVLGMAGYFAGVVQAPMTAFVIILEMTGNNANAIPVMLASMLGLAASRLVLRQPLYHTLAQAFLTPAAGSAGHPPATE